MTDPADPAQPSRPDPEGGPAKPGRASTPPWERGLWRRIHRWGVQNPKWYYITPPSLWAAMIYITSIAQMEGSGGIKERLPWLQWLFEFDGLDKIGHFAAYAVLSLLILRGWQREKMPPIGLHGFTLLLCAVFGMMLEIHQGLTGRNFDLLDEVANVMGALAGQAAWHLLMLKWGRRTRLYPGLFRPAQPPPAPRRDRR